MRRAPTPRALALALLMAQGAGCGPGPLETALDHWNATLAASARGDLNAAEAARVATVRSAQASMDADESQAGQAALLLALALRRPSATAEALGSETAGEAANTQARRAALRRTRTPRMPAHLRLTRLVAHCQYSADQLRAHHASLCWSAVLAALPTPAQFGPGELEVVRDAPSTVRAPIGFARLGRGHRAAAAEGLGNANAEDRVSSLSLARRIAEHPVLAALQGAVLADPLNPDLLAIFAARLTDLCSLLSPKDDPNLIHALRRARADLFDAALDLDDFAQNDRRCAARRHRRRELQTPICPHLHPLSPSIAPPRLPPLVGPGTPEDPRCDLGRP